MPLSAEQHEMTTLARAAAMPLGGLREAVGERLLFLGYCLFGWGLGESELVDVKLRSMANFTRPTRS